MWRAALVIVVMCSNGCTLLGGFAGLLVASHVNEAPKPAPPIAQPPPRKTLEAADVARCQIERDVLASAAANEPNQIRRRLQLAALPNCLDPYWETPGYRLQPVRPIVVERERPASPLLGILAGMALGSIVDALIVRAMLQDIGTTAR